MHPLERLNIGADDDGLTVAKLLALKAEKEDLKRINEDKANKSDCENLKDSIKKLDGLINAVILMLNETLKLKLPRPLESKNERAAKIRALLQQMDALGSWA